MNEKKKKRVEETIFLLKLASEKLKGIYSFSDWKEDIEQTAHSLETELKEA